MKHLRKFESWDVDLINDTESYLETIFADVRDSGYYDVKIDITDLTEKICKAEVRLKPVEGKLWSNPKNNMIYNVALTYPYNIVNHYDTSIENEYRMLEIKTQTLNSLNAIIEDIRGDGNKAELKSTNRIGDLTISIDIKK